MIPPSPSPHDLNASNDSSLSELLMINEDNETDSLECNDMSSVDSFLSSCSSLNWCSEDSEDESERSWSWRSRRSVRSTSDTQKHSKGRVVSRERFHRAVHAMSLSNTDVQELLDRDENFFSSLKQSLRSQNAITNSLIKQGVHIYVRECCSGGALFVANEDR